MPDINHAQVSYPGVINYDSFSITDVSGISPSIGIFTIYPQGTYPDPDGDLTLSYNGTQIIFRNMHIDSFTFQSGSGGKMVTLRMLDERWKWADGAISLRANFKLPSGWVDPAHEYTPQQLAKLCFDKMGAVAYDVSALPNDARPEIDWDQANPAQELAKLCDDLGCRIVPIRSDGSWRIVVTGEGQDLPDGLPYNDAGQGIDPKELPDFIKIVTAPVQFQYAVKLEPIAKDFDLSWKTLDKISYRITNDATSAYGLAAAALNGCQQLSQIRYLEPDGTFVSNYEIGAQTVLRSWRIFDGKPYGQFSDGGKVRGQKIANQATIDVPGYPKKVFRKQILISQQLVQSYVDVYGEEHKRPAFMFGLFTGQNSIGGGNYPLGQRLDAQQTDYRRVTVEEQTSFSVSPDELDPDKTIISTSKPMLRVTNPNSYTGDALHGYHLAPVIWGAAKLWLMCSAQIRNIDTWQPERVEYFYPLGTGGNKDFCMTVIKNDIQPWYITKYNKLELDQNDNLKVKKDYTTNNKDEVEKKCLYYAQQIANTLETITTATRTYIGLFKLDLDGAIQQVSYRVGRDGASTIASKGTEHDFDLPTYEDRRHRDATRGVAARQDVEKEIANQRFLLKGTWNTA